MIGGRLDEGAEWLKMEFEEFEQQASKFTALASTAALIEELEKHF